MVAAAQFDRPGKKILLVEDNYLVAMQMAAMLRDLGCEVVGPVATVNEAVDLAADEQLFGAILDVNLKDGNCSPVARALKSRSTPYVFVTGYASPELPLSVRQDVRRLHKPVDPVSLARAIDEFGSETRTSA